MKHLTGLYLLIMVALFSGCAKTANDIAEIKAEHQKSIAALNARVDKLASENIALRAEMAAKNEAAALELKKNLDGVSAAISQVDFQGLKSWRETGVLKANTLSLTSTIFDDKNSLFLTAQSLIFMDGPNTVAMLGGGKFELTGDDSSSITLKSKATPTYLTLEADPIMSGLTVKGHNDTKAYTGIMHVNKEDKPTILLTTEQLKSGETNAFGVMVDAKDTSIELTHSGSTAQTRVSSEEATSESEFGPTGGIVRLVNNKDGSVFIARSKNREISSVIGMLTGDKKSSALLRMDDTSNDGLTKMAFSGGAHGFSLNKGNREIVDLSLVKRGARLKFFDEAGDNAPIMLSLDNDGMPYIFTSFGDKNQVLSPKFPRR